MIGQNSVAAAVAVLGHDLASDQTWKTSGQDRIINAVGMAGSAAALDTKVDVMVGEVKVAELYNSSLGAVQKDTDMFRGGAFVLGGTPISILVTDAPATNPINVAVDLQDA